MRLRITAPLVIGVLCLTVAALTLAMAAASKRLAVAIVIVLPCLFASFVSYRRHREHLRLLDFQAAAPTQTQPLSSTIPDPATFIETAPALAAQFHTWASALYSAPLSTPSQLENFASRHGDAMPSDGSLFLHWVAAYGEALRASTNGRWALGRFATRGEPVVVSGRFPFLRHRVLLAALQLLDAAADFRAQ